MMSASVVILLILAFILRLIAAALKPKGEQ